MAHDQGIAGPAGSYAVLGAPAESPLKRLNRDAAGLIATFRPFLRGLRSDMGGDRLVDEMRRKSYRVGIVCLLRLIV